MAPHGRLHVGLEGAGLAAALGGIVARRVAAAQLYLCGPAPFMARTRERAAAAWPADAVHVAHFD